MQFNSIYFILFFLPVVYLLYRLALRKDIRSGRLVLIAASLLFCGLVNVWSLAVLIAQIAIGYALACRICACMEKGAETDRSSARIVMTAGIAIQVAALLFFKYTGFIVGNIGLILQKDLVWHDVILPLGISYTAFTQIAFLVDCYRGRIRGKIPLDVYALYISFFPKLSQGPIASGTDLWDRFVSGGSLSIGNVCDGAVIFILGLSKKLFLADVFGRVPDFGFTYIQELSSLDALIVILSYTFQIYFDFSGYSDMAIGIARILGFRLPANFNSPYRAQSITDFWRRWHMSLTSFLREYIYFPLGGSRRGALRTCVNIMIVFIISGMWHGANWTFILWGVCHGALQILERTCGRVLKHIPGFIRQAATFAAAAVLWLLFRSPSVHEFNRMMWHLFLDGNLTVHSGILELFRLPGVRTIAGAYASDDLLGVCSMLVYFLAAFFICLQPRNNENTRFRRNGAMLAVTVLLFVLCVFSVNQVSTFIYTSF